MTKPLSKKALELLKELFSEMSNLQVPAGIAEQVIEIRSWAKDELQRIERDNPSAK